MEWLRPHQQMENILTPLSGFIKTLTNLLRLTIDFLLLVSKCLIII